MTFSPYLHFQGNCAEAMRFYADVFGATDLQMMTYADAPPDSGMPRSDRVMHASLTAGGGTLMGSDFPEGFEGDAQKAVSISFAAPDTATARGLYDRLLEGGDVIMEFGPTFWSAGFGMVRDRFGTHWMLSAADGPEST